MSKHSKKAGYFLSVIVILLSLSACVNTVSSRPIAWKSLQVASYYEKPIRLIESKGISLFGPGGGVNSHGFLLHPNGGGIGKHTYGNVKLEYPIEITWKEEGCNQIQYKYFETLDGFTGRELENEATIWLYFEESGEPNLKLFHGDSMISRRQLEEVIFKRVWKRLKINNYSDEFIINLKEVRGLDSLDIDSEKYYKTKNPKSFDRLKFTANGLGVSEYTYDEIQITYPITVKWSIEGESEETKSMSFDSLAGFTGEVIKDKITIWLVFDSDGLPRFRFFYGDWTSSSEELEIKNKNKNSNKAMERNFE
jgi:hypothetical protein